MLEAGRTVRPIDQQLIASVQVMPKEGADMKAMEARAAEVSDE